MIVGPLSQSSPVTFVTISSSWFPLIRVVIIPGMLFVVDDGSIETSGWVDASSDDGDGGQVHQEQLSELGKGSICHGSQGYQEAAPYFFNGHFNSVISKSCTILF
ncbi:hypothetical protein FF2_018006 [Malus domestica]